MTPAKETWYVETTRDSPRSVLGQHWSVDMSGPHVGYDTRDEALEWARALRTIQPHVRLRHDITTFEEVPPS